MANFALTPKLQHYPVGYERERILRALGFDDDINPRAWSTDALVQEIKDCIEGERLLRGEQWLMTN